MAGEDGEISTEDQKLTLCHVFSFLLKSGFQTAEQRQQLRRLFPNLNLSDEQAKESLNVFIAAACQHFEGDVKYWYDDRLMKLSGSIDDGNLLRNCFDNEEADVQQLQPPNISLPACTYQKINASCYTEQSQDLQKVLAERRAQLAALRLRVTDDLQKLRSFCKQFDTLNLAFPVEQENHP